MPELSDRERPADQLWLAWVKRLRAIAQSGLTFTEGPYDRQRYEQLRQLAAEMAAYPGPHQTLESVFSGYQGYATPLLIVRAAVFDRSDRILMVRETADGRWTLPGGWVDVGDSPASAAEREVSEETGYRVRASKLAAIYDKLRHDHPPSPDHAYLMFFLCALEGGSPRPSIETSEVGWFPPASLPELSVARATEAQILRMVEHHENPDLPTDFD